MGIIFTGYNINSKEELDVWCGDQGRNKLYNVLTSQQMNIVIDQLIIKLTLDLL